MSMPRALSSGFSCRACRAAVARASPRASPKGAVVRASWIPSATFQRPITSTVTRRADKHDPANADPEFTFLDDAATSNIRSTPEAPEPTQTPSPPPALQPSEASPLPWYLQNRPTPTPQQAAILPDLPPNSPPLLETLLDYIANTAGLDDLTILDLRHLDPPPALGPKLIMIVATARSEKHLHVSADRFCRYLRREHHLRANAAGLLGRNELKIKLRRKAKRMKMLANVGGKEMEGNIDDGIRTGWICCTVGKIEAHPEDTEMPGLEPGKEFVGFRDVKPGVNVVIQMFTEEKRAETDLETLWGGVLRTHDRKDRTADQALKESDENDDNEEEHPVRIEAVRITRQPSRPSPAASTPSHQFNKPQSSAGDFFPPASNTHSFQQIRRLHTVGLRR